MTDATHTARRSGARSRTARRTGTDRVAEVAEASTRRRSGLVGFVVGLAIAVGVAFLIAQNTASVPISWLGFDVTGPVWVELAIAFSAGLVAGPLLLAGARLTHNRRIERLEMIERSRS